MGREHLWSPPTNPFWEVCRNKKKVLQYGMAASHKEWSLCPGAKAFELVPCCWCTNWIAHMQFLKEEHVQHILML